MPAVVRANDALLAWLATRPRGASAVDEAFTCYREEADASDADPIEGAVDAVFATL